MALPNFLCVGALKTGTTWLYQNMLVHPDVCLTPKKELHYFNNSSAPFIGDLFRTRSKRERLRHDLWLALHQIYHRPKRVNWYAHYFLLPHSDRWYDGLFRPNSTQISGEICPAYFHLNDQQIAHVHRLLPNAKLIVLLRDPIARAWLSIKMRIPESEYKNSNFLKSLQSNFFPRSRYTTMLQKWRRYYADEQLFVGFFEHLNENPTHFLEQIYRFLKLPVHTSPAIHRKVNVNQQRQQHPPPKIAHLMATKLLDEIAEVHMQFDNEYTASWMQQAKAYLNPK